ncbi:MAG: transposase [Thomasclavelia sp.]
MIKKSIAYLELADLYIEQDKYDEAGEIINSALENVSKNEKSKVNKKLEELNLRSEAYLAYGKKFMEYYNEYGNISVSYPYDYIGQLNGFCYAKLIDFNNDNIDELLLVYNKDGEYHYDLFGYDGKLVLLESSIESAKKIAFEEDNNYVSELYSYDGGRNSLLICEYDNKYYIKTGSLHSYEYSYFHGYDDEGNFGIQETIIYDYESSKYYINKDEITLEQIDKESNKYEAFVELYLRQDISMIENAGIVDALHCSDGSIYGSLKEAIDFYRNVVEPAFAQRNNLYNKKRKISHYLRHHKDLPVEVRRSLIDKMDRLDKMIKTMDAPFCKKRDYYQILNESISKAVKSFISELDHDNLVVLELLDNKEFNSCKTVNGRFSMFARGQLQNRLIKELNWKGYDFAQIEPAFTSQTCPICGNIDEHNRNGKSFKCTCCGHKDDADHNAAINIKNRFYDEEVSAICDKYYNSSKRQEAIKDLYKRRNEEYCKQHLNESVSV